MLAAHDTPRRIDLLREIATGPSSAVFVASCERERGASLAAVKLVRPRDRRDLERLVQVRDRGRVLAALGHRHIAAATELARVGDYPALVAPWVDGVDLLDWVEILRETGTVLPGRVICDIVRSTAVALDAAQNRAPWPSHKPLGIAHRDLKPSNIMIGRDGELVVVDFGTGFTSLAGRSARAGALKRGLVKYLSPERREGKRAGASSDVYALGIIAVELFRGRWLRRLRAKNPAHDRHLAEVVATIGRMDMRTTADDATLRSLLLRMVAFDRDARPTAAEIAQTFRVLGDRAMGPSLEHFAHDQLLPWLEPVPDRPDEALEGLSPTLVEDQNGLAALPVHEAEGSRGQDGPPSGWIETEEGWREHEEEEQLLGRASGGRDFLDESTGLALARMVGELDDPTDDASILDPHLADASTTGALEPLTQPALVDYDTDTQTVEVEALPPRRVQSASKGWLYLVGGMFVGVVLGGLTVGIVAWGVLGG
ncbi:MAG: protein kinase [Proteobacteria bacterium]|nr:protein kinase [Pseudomonadota bacterium]